MANADPPDPKHFRPGDYFTGSVIVRLRSELRTIRSEDLLNDAARSAAPQLVELLTQLEVKSAQRLVKSIDLDTLFKFERIAAENGQPPQNSLADYWRIDVAHRSGDLREVATSLQKIPEVADAYLDIHVVPAAVNPSDDPEAHLQGYLEAADLGIDAKWAWLQAGGDGSGVALADLEEGWNVNHEDLTPVNPGLIAGTNRMPAFFSSFDPGFRGWNHGTSCVGIIAARDNTLGLVGIAPGVAPIHLASVWDGPTGTSGHVVNALVAAIAALAPGDVVMLELQTANQGPAGWPNNYPIEVKDAERDAIRLAVTSRKLVVVAAAGNEGDDLDNYVSTQGTSIGKKVFDRTSPDFRDLDSGSIMVASATSTVPHRRMNDPLNGNLSNFGSRIDCYAWGENVATTGGLEPFPNTSIPTNQWYRQHFSGTSAATPIVAGAAILLQSINKASTGVPLTGIQMRALLSDPANGTAPAPSTTPPKIGVMPNLRKLTDALRLTPDIFMRDSIGDDGTVPSAGKISGSPDIVVRKTPSTDPQAEFGETSLNVNRDDLDSLLVAGSAATIYLRGRNRGGSDAIDVVGRVWWSEPATLVTPDLWTFIGQTTPFTVPADHSLTVSPPIAWTSMPLGHKCLIATLDCARDPSPPIPPAYNSWSEYEDLIRSWNNIAWRNINVVPILPGVPLPLPFRMVGAPKSAQLFDIEIDVSLPEGSAATLDLPGSMGGGSLDDPNFRHVRSRSEDGQKLALPFRGTVRLRNVKVPPGSGNKALLTVTVAAGRRGAQGRIILKQRFGSVEAGRITWRFVESLAQEK